MMKTYTLLNGVEIPAVGFGTYLATEGNGKQGILNAFAAGYRYLDTASFYKNEEEIGEAIRESGISRKELFLASKVWRTEMGYEETKTAFAASLQRLGTDYLDLYLIHWPKASADTPDWKQRIQDTWRAMEELYEAGQIRAIGLSNFLPHHIEALLETAKVMPMVNQLELHVGYMQEEAVRYSQEKGILVQAWSPLGRRKLLTEPVIQSFASKYQVTVAQLLLGFLDQQGISVIPKASTVERCKENLDIHGFTLSNEDMYFLKCLPQMGWSGEHPDL
ncbi:MAG: aldo/keto reductase [Lachnospiraceae bacterium]|nr:aldo/keto reductase [Lachnospiraceae bacterium]